MSILENIITTDFYILSAPNLLDIDSTFSSIAYTNKDKFTLLNPKEDIRFSNSSWVRLHFSLLPQLTMWCLKPNGNKTFQLLAHNTLKPLAAIADYLLNIPSLLISSTVLLMVAVTNVATYAISFFNPDVMVTGTSFLSQSFDNSILILLSQNTVPTFASIEYLQSLFNLIFRNKITTPEEALLMIVWLPGFLINNVNENKLECILDQGRLHYLKEKCGWNDLSDEDIKQWVQKMWLEALEDKSLLPHYTTSKDLLTLEFMDEHRNSHIFTTDIVYKEPSSVEQLTIQRENR